MIVFHKMINQANELSDGYNACHMLLFFSAFTYYNRIVELIIRA